jgi:hypothetical protein
MRRLFSKTDLKALSSIVALLLLLSSVPSAGGVVVIPGPSQPQFTVNVCQPTQAFSCTSSTPLARPGVNALQFVLFSKNFLTVKPTAPTVERNVPPDTPPPKRPV